MSETLLQLVAIHEGRMYVVKPNEGVMAGQLHFPQKVFKDGKFLTDTELPALLESIGYPSSYCWADVVSTSRPNFIIGRVVKKEFLELPNGTLIRRAYVKIDEEPEGEDTAEGYKPIGWLSPEEIRNRDDIGPAVEHVIQNYDFQQTD